MTEKLGKIPPMEKLGSNNCSATHSPTSNFTGTSLHSGCGINSSNAERAIGHLERGKESITNLALLFRPKLEKIGAVTPGKASSKILWNDLRDLAKHLSKSSKLIDRNSKLLKDWAATFETDEISMLVLEYQKFALLHSNINKKLAERMEVLSSKVKPLNRVEIQRNVALAKYIKAKRSFEDFKKKSTDQATMAQLQNDVNYYSTSLKASQLSLEKTVREDVRPAIFAFAYAFKASTISINKICQETLLDFDEFERMIKNPDSIYESKLNLTGFDLLSGISDLSCSSARIERSPSLPERSTDASYNIRQNNDSLISFIGEDQNSLNDGEKPLRLKETEYKSHYHFTKPAKIFKPFGSDPRDLENPELHERFNEKLSFDTAANYNTYVQRNAGDQNNSTVKISHYMNQQDTSVWSKT